MHSGEKTHTQQFSDSKPASPLVLDNRGSPREKKHNKKFRLDTQKRGSAVKSNPEVGCIWDASGHRPQQGRCASAGEQPSVEVDPGVCWVKWQLV